MNIEQIAEDVKDVFELDETVEFEAWPKIPRGQHQRAVITEKMDGTNACIIIRDGKIVGIQSRKRFLQPTYIGGKEADNYGFANWVFANALELVKLGEGKHYGEWTGAGIQKNPHNLDAKYFYLFDRRRFGDHNPPPTICRLVEILYEGEANEEVIARVMDDYYIRETSSGNNPEGVIVNWLNTQQLMKFTFKNTRGKWNA